VSTPPTPRSGSEVWKCDDGHIRAVGDSTKFCGTCGKEFKIAVSEVWKCGTGHTRAPGDTTKFCGTCGKEFKIAVSEVWKCGTGHTRAPGDTAKFCGVCGEEYKNSSGVSCPNGHSRPELFENIQHINVETSIYMKSRMS